jgi:hypothetical protein
MKKPNTSKGRLTDERGTSIAVTIAQDPPAGDDIGFMPAALCHVFFPYHEPPAGTDFWTRRSGDYLLSIAAVPGTDPRTNERINFGIPSGPKPRLMLAALNSIALAKGTPELHFENSLTDFVGNVLQLNTDGRTINKVKAEMTKLARAHVEIAFVKGDRTFQDSTKIVRGLDLTWTKKDNQFPLWGNHLRFSDDYFNALQAHGVPLDMRALRGMTNNAVAIDVYSFLAHRLHHLQRPLFLSWVAIKDQFGYTYSRMDHFKMRFRETLALVKVMYPAAKIQEVENRGFYLFNSPPPVLKNQHLVTKPAALIEPPTPIAAPKAKPRPKVASKRNKEPQTVSNVLQTLFPTIQERGGDDRS